MICESRSLELFNLWTAKVDGGRLAGGERQLMKTARDIGVVGMSAINWRSSLIACSFLERDGLAKPRCWLKGYKNDSGFTQIVVSHSPIQNSNSSYKFPETSKSNGSTMYLCAEHWHQCRPLQWHYGLIECPAAHKHRSYHRQKWKMSCCYSLRALHIQDWKQNDWRGASKRLPSIELRSMCQSLHRSESDIRALRSEKAHFSARNAGEILAYDLFCKITISVGRSAPLCVCTSDKRSTSLTLIHHAKLDIAHTHTGNSVLSETKHF